MITSLYIHIPFCDHICSYCDFIKVYSSLFDRKLYLKRLVEEYTSLNIKDDTLKTIYIGGGTPSSLENSELEYLLSFLKKHQKKVDEFTFEANPESLTVEKIKLLKKYQVSRVSLGVETTSSRGLELLERKHKLKDVEKVIIELKDNGIYNINLDFIYGYEDESIEELKEDIDFALKKDVKHLSFYTLIIEDNTVYKLKKYKELDDDTLFKMYKYINERLKDNGFIHYEVSNYAKEGYESLHNKVYWHDEKYYAIGLSSSSYIYDKRIKNTSSITNYLKGIVHREIDLISKESEEEEFIMLSFRLLEGLSIREYKKRFNADFIKKYSKAIEKNRDFLNIDENHIAIKEDYIYIMDKIVIDFM